MRIISLFNQKGGVGKTTSTVNIGAALAEAGKRVVLIDLDPQANLTAHMGIDPDGVGISTYRVLTDEIPLAESLITIEGTKKRLRVAPSTTDLAAAEVELVSVVGRETLLRKMAQASGEKNGGIDADFVLIDCPPSLGLLSLNALVYSTEVIVPLQAHFLALQGMEKLFDTVGMVRQALNPGLRISGILFCQYESATKLTAEVTGEVAKFLEQAKGTNHPVAHAQIFHTTIRRNVKLAEAPSFGQSIHKYAPLSAGSADYTALAAEILRMKIPGVSAPNSSVPATETPPLASGK
ncbi:MAG TPA: AAA family ATPase [Phycisphaerae bacterium]|jgi:chromosome partitioning protein